MRELSSLGISVTRVLLVEDDETFLRAVERELRREGLDVHSAESVTKALQWLSDEKYEVLLTDLQMNGLSGLDLIAQARDSWPDMRAVLMSGLATARDYEKAMELGAVRVLCKPFSTDQLLDVVRQAADCRQGFRGSIHGLGLIDLLQMFHYAQRTVAVEIDSGRNGRVCVERGSIVHAEHGSLVGEPALTAILSLASGALRTSAYVQVGARTIERGFNEVLLDALRFADESTRQQGFGETRSSLHPRPSVLPARSEPVLFWSERPVPIIPHAAAAVRTSLAPRTAAHLPLDHVFASAWQGTPQASPTLAVLALRLSGRGFVTLQGDFDPDATETAIRNLVDAARRLTCASAQGVMERATATSLVYVVWDSDADYAFVLADGFQIASAAAWLRAAAQTFARRLFGQEP